MKEDMEKNKNRNKKFSYPVFLVCFLILGLCLLFSFSYAIQTPSDKNSGGVTTLEITMADGGVGTTILGMEPLSDDNGINIVDYKFTVINHGPDRGTYQVLIEDLPIGEVNDGCTPESLLFRSQLRYQLSLDKKQIALRDLSEVKMNVLDVQQINTGDTHQYSLRVWLPSSASKTDWMRKHYHYKIIIQQ